MEPQEPLQKDLGFNISATLALDGTLTLTETEAIRDDDEEVVGYTTTTMALPGQAARTLLNFLSSPDGRNHLGARKLR